MYEIRLCVTTAGPSDADAELSTSGIFIEVLHKVERSELPVDNAVEVGIASALASFVRDIISEIPDGETYDIHENNEEKTLDMIVLEVRQTMLHRLHESAEHYLSQETAPMTDWNAAFRDLVVGEDGD